jgi:hypothetical protein
MKVSKIGTIFVVFALVFTLAYFVYSYQITQQNIQQANEDLKKAQSDMDSVVNTAIVHCQQNPGDACNIIMKQWQDKCQEDNMKDIPSCHDGRIEAYFKNVDLGSSSTIPQTSISQENKSSSGTSQMDSANFQVLNPCSMLLQSINDARQNLAGGIPSNMLSTSSDMAYNQPINDSQDSLKSCKDSLTTIQQQCVQYPSMSVCKDPRLKQLTDTISKFIYAP